MEIMWVDERRPIVCDMDNNKSYIRSLKELYDMTFLFYALKSGLFLTDLLKSLKLKLNWLQVKWQSTMSVRVTFYGLRD